MTPSPAMQALFDALDAKHKETWGDLSDKVDWYGIPNRDLPQEEREAILAEARRKRNEKFDAKQKRTV